LAAVPFPFRVYHIEKKHLRSLTAEEAREEELLLLAHDSMHIRYAVKEIQCKGWACVPSQ
jgi:hypothetical protein